MVKKHLAFTIGRRKRSVARVRFLKGKGNVVINGRDFEEYFGRNTTKMVMKQPLQLTETHDKYDIFVNEGAKSVTAVATHPVFSGKSIKLLQESPIIKVVVCDTIKLEKEKIHPFHP